MSSGPVGPLRQYVPTYMAIGNEEENSPGQPQRDADGNINDEIINVLIEGMLSEADMVDCHTLSPATLARLNHVRSAAQYHGAS